MSQKDRTMPERNGTEVLAARRLHEIATLLGQVKMSAEVWPHGSDDVEDMDPATVVDVVRVDDRLHFVVVLDG